MSQEEYVIDPEDVLKIYAKRTAELQHQLIVFEATFVKLKEELDELKSKIGGDTNG